MFNNSGSQKIILTYLFLALVVNISGLDFSFLPASFFIVWLINLIYNVNNGYLIRHIFVLFVSLQYAMGPTLSYYFNISETYKMVIPYNEYFSFSFPAILLFSFGLFFNTKTNEDVVFMKLYKTIAESSINEKILQRLMFFSAFIDIINPPVPEALDFVKYVLASYKYAFISYHLITSVKIDYKLLALPVFILVYRTLQTAMFHDFVTWSLFWAFSFCIRTKPTIKIILIYGSAFLFSIILIQLSKGAYREQAWGLKGTATKQGGLNTYSEIVSEEASSGINAGKLSENIVRINQAWITCRAMNYVPRNVDYAGYELISKYLEAAILPRFLAPDKLNAGDKELFHKYTGLQLTDTTSMGLGIVADSWVSFGKYGGWAMMLVFGLIINVTLKFYQNLTKKFPLVYFFLPLVYIYSIRPDCETQTSFGHLIKSSFLVIFIAYRFLPRSKITRNIAIA